MSDEMEDIDKVTQGEEVTIINQIYEDDYEGCRTMKYMSQLYKYIKYSPAFDELVKLRHPCIECLYYAKMEGYTVIFIGEMYEMNAAKFILQERQPLIQLTYVALRISSALLYLRDYGHFILGNWSLSDIVLSPNACSDTNAQLSITALLKSNTICTLYSRYYSEYIFQKIECPDEKLSSKSDVWIFGTILQKLFPIERQCDTIRELIKECLTSDPGARIDIEKVMYKLEMKKNVLERR